MVRVEAAEFAPGVTDAARERIFEPFWNGEGSSSSGVGLAICRAMIEAQGGSIHVESPPGGGARFVFTLPARHE